MHLEVYNYIMFAGNSALNGGGLLLADDSDCYLQPNM